MKKSPENDTDMGDVITTSPTLPPCMQRRLDAASNIESQTKPNINLPPGVTLHTGVDTFKLSANLIPLALGFSRTSDAHVDVYVYYRDNTMKHMSVNATDLRKLANDPTVANIVGLSTTTY